MIFYKNKKNLAAVGIMAILFSVVFLITPKKAEAVVPTSDAKVTVSTGATAESTAANQVKEYILDAVVSALAKTLLSALTQSIVNWIKGGFEGNPLFITDYESYLTDAADQATGAFMKKFLSPEVYNAICTPFRANLYLALKSVSSYEQQMTCTLSTVLNNASDFGKALEEGDWYDFAVVTLDDANNPFGSFIVTSDQLALLRKNAQSNAQTESIFNQGFLSVKKCTEYYDNEWTGEFKCTKYENTSPGKWVESQLSQSTGIEFQQIALADEIDEIVSALISQLLSTVLQGEGGITGTELPETPAAPEEYSTLIISISGNGAVTKNPDESVYTIDPPETVELTATPYEGYTFTGWSEDLTGTANPASISMDGNKYVTASFTLGASLTVNVVGSGVVTKNPDKSAYLTIPPENVTLEAIPQSGYKFDHWSGDASGTAATTVVSMDRDKTITAVFTSTSSY